MNRSTFLNLPFKINEFTARGEIEIKGTRLSYDIQNGIASIRYIKYKGTPSNTIIDALSEQWIDFDEYKNNEFEDENSTLNDFCNYNGFHAFLVYGYYSNHTFYFYVQAVIQAITNKDIFSIEVFSPCLINHFHVIHEFDFNSNGYIEDTPCAIYNFNEMQIKIYKTVAVQFDNSITYRKFLFQKNFVGGFRFESKIPFTNDIIKKIVDTVNAYCCFILKDNGFFISNVMLNAIDKDHVKSYYSLDNKKISTELMFSFDDINLSFYNLFELFFEDHKKFSLLYEMETNIYKPFDILRVASMFENQYRKQVELGLQDYIEQEEKFKIAYNDVIKIEIKSGELEKDIINGEISKRNQKVRTSLKMQLTFVFERLLNILGTNSEQIKKNFSPHILNIDISKLATIIKNARNDIAHFLESKIDYELALKNTYALQLIIYYMVFERVGLSNDTIKNIILNAFPFNKLMFGIK